MSEAIKQATLVALWGEKPAPLARLIRDCQALTRDVAAVPYDLAQVHATLVGLARAPGARSPAAPDLNRNFLALRGREVAMDIPALVAHLREAARLPWRLRIGGFAEGDAPFLSRGRPPFERSFSIQGDRIVLMGWPTTGASRDGTLDGMRRAAQRFGILHAYHRSDPDIDDDLYLRLGLARGDLDPVLRASAEERVRRHLAALAPLVIEVSLADLWLVVYEDESLPLASSQAWSLADPRAAEHLARALR